MGKDRAILLAGLAALTLVAWAYLVHDARQMESCGECMGMALPQGREWSGGDLSALFGMWSIMMIGMMVPSAAPVVMLVAAVNARRRAQQQALVPSGLFLAGYLIVWIGFSAGATLLQWQLHARALLSPMMLSTSPLFGSAVLVAAGVFQFSPLKRACLVRCRTPLTFLVTEWREGPGGALLMGLRHGSYCVGCCWLLMCVLFVTGVMNILWVALLTLFVMGEKLAPRHVPVARVSGALLIIWGLGTAVGRL